MLAKAVLLATLALLVPATAAANAASDDPRISIALVSMTRGAGMTTEQLDTVETLVLSALESTANLRVVGRADVNALLSLESKKQAAGCSANTACIVGIAGAMGVDLVATADVGRLGKKTIVALTVIVVHTAASLVHARQVVSSDDDLVTAADKLAGAVATALLKRPNIVAGKTPKLPTAPPPDPPRQATETPPPAATHEASPTPPPGNTPAVDLTPPPPTTNAFADQNERAHVLDPTATLVDAPMSDARKLGIAAAAIGGVALIVGTIIGITVQLDTTGIQTNPQYGVSIQSRVDSVNARALTTNILLPVGGVFAAGGAGIAVAF